MNTLFKLSKDLVIYSSIIVASTLFIAKKLFGKRKINKTFYDKNKKKISMKAKLFFRDLSKKVEIVETTYMEDELEGMENYSSSLNNTGGSNSLGRKNNKYIKMKRFVEKVTKEFDKSLAKTGASKDVEMGGKGEEKINICPAPTKKDQIFYYLLNNISTMMVKAGTQSNTPVKNANTNENVTPFNRAQISIN